MIGLDLGDVLVNLWKAWKQDRELQAWIRLLLSTAYSGFIALAGVWGGALAAGKPMVPSFGLGLLASSVAVLGVLLRDPRARSLLLSVPAPVIKEFQETQGQTFIGPEKK